MNITQEDIENQIKENYCSYSIMSDDGTTDTGIEIFPLNEGFFVTVKKAFKTDAEMKEYVCKIQEL